MKLGLYAIAHPAHPFPPPLYFVIDLKVNLNRSLCEILLSLTTCKNQVVYVLSHFSGMNEELELLRNVQAQFYESLKMKKEYEASEKSDTGTSELALADYENFQMLNQKMQQEILQLRAYIEQQQNIIQVSTVQLF